MSVPVKNIHNWDECDSHPTDAHENNGDSSLNAVHYEQTPERLKLMAKHEAVKEHKEEELNKDSREDVRLQVKF